MSRQILAIDIRNEAVAAVLINTGLKNTTIQRYAYVQQNGSSEEAPTIQTMLKTIYENLAADDPTCVVSLPADQLFFRNTSLPFSDDKKIRQILPFELETVLPVSIDNLVIDYQKGLEEQRTEVVAVAIEQEKLQAYITELQASAIHPQLIVPCSFPLVLSLLEHDQQMPAHALLLDVGHHLADLYLLVDGRIAMVRSLPSSIENESKSEAFALRVRQTLAAFGDNTAMDFSPGMVYLSGPAIDAVETRKLIAASLDLPTKMVDLCAYLPRIEAGAEVQDWKPCLGDNALAMALLEAESKPCPTFHRSSSPLRNYWRLYSPYIKGPSILLVAVLMLGLFGVWLEGHFLQKQIDALDSRMVQVFESTFPGARPIKNISIADQMASKIKAAKGSSVDPTLGVSKVRAIDILKAISESIPKEIDVTINRMVVGGEDVTLAGNAAAFNAVDDIKNRLSGVPVFKHVTIASANMDKSGKIVKFKLKIDL